MKKLKLLALSILLGGGLLSACATNNEDSSSSSESSESSSKVSDKFKVTFEADSEHPGTEVTLTDANQQDIALGSTVKAGSVVLVNVYNQNEEIKGCKVNGKKLSVYATMTTHSIWYSFNMPKEDAVITVTWESEEYNLTYDSEVITCAYSIEELTMGGLKSPKSEAGLTIYVTAYKEGQTITGIFYNGTAVTRDTSYEGMFVGSFVMPEEDVTLTFTSEAAE